MQRSMLVASFDEAIEIGGYAFRFHHLLWNNPGLNLKDVRVAFLSDAFGCEKIGVPTEIVV